MSEERAMHEEEEDKTIYRVVVNQEEQYSIWPAGRDNLPAGWSDCGKSGDKAQCLAFINEVWTDMRPLSLRRKMEATGRAVGAEDTPTANAASGQVGHRLSGREC